MLVFFTALTRVSGIILKDTCMSPGVIAITFDEGPTGHTADILEELDDLDCPATFHFTVQNRSRGNIRSLYKRAVDENHTVGLRVNPGRDYNSMSADEIDEDIEAQIEALKDATGGEDVKFGRAPVDYGDVNQDVYNTFMKNNITQTGYMYCLYDDANDPDDAIANYKNILNDSNPKYDSFIFLLHDEKEKSFPLLRDMVEIGREKGYEFVTLEQCLSGYSPEEGTYEGRKKKRKSGTAEALNTAVFTVYSCLMM